MPSPEEMAAGLERRTGRSIQEWIALAPDGSFTERAEHLAAAHGFKPSEARASCTSPGT
jgi:hypothetical protein